MPLDTVLPISSIPFVYDDCDFFIKLGSVENTCWSLRPKWAENMENGLDYLEIHRTPSTGKVNLKVNLMFYFEDDEGFQRDLTTYEGRVEDGQNKVYIIVGGWPRNFDDSEGDRIKGSIVLYNDSKKNSEMTTRKPEILPENVPLLHLSEDLLLLLNNPDSFADATLKCGSVEIPVHRSILSARSPVFAAMFKSKMQESEGVVDIVDIEANVLKCVLKYIYSGKTDPLTDALAEDLLFAADKYQLKDLKLMCLSELKLNITTNNVSRMLVLGHLHDEGLKDDAKKFVCRPRSRRFSNLKKSKQWKELEREYPCLAIEVLNFALEYAHKR